MRTRTWIGVIVSLISLTAAGSERRGAKAIFVDTTSGAVVQGGKPRTAPGLQNTVRAEKPAVVPEVAGLMYYLELVSRSGQKSRVTADRTFRSGDRILVHVVSSIDGDVEVYQRNADGSATMLFPDERVNGGSSFVPKGVDTILPSPMAWFRFDDQTGTEHLSIVLRPRTPAAPARPGVPMASMSFDEIRSGGASKGLVLETEKSGVEQATYVVRPVQEGRSAEPIVVAIPLKHQ